MQNTTEQDTTSHHITAFTHAHGGQDRKKLNIALHGTTEHHITDCVSAGGASRTAKQSGKGQNLTLHRTAKHRIAEHGLYRLPRRNQKP